MISVADPGERGGHSPSGPVKISHNKDGHQRQPHRFEKIIPVSLRLHIEYCQSWF